MYNRITRLTEDDLKLVNSELKALSKVWHERKYELGKGEKYQDFLKKLQREWAIETGIIERLYTWDRGVTEILIEQGIDATLIAHKGGIQRNEADHIKEVINDQLSTIDHLFEFVKGELPLTEHFIRGLHSQLTIHQEFTTALASEGAIVQIDLVRGDYKKWPNNPRRPDGQIHEYCPPEIVKEEMERLVEWYRDYETNHIPSEVLSAWLHHRFTQIHPFQDGNGRVARALATLVFLKAGLFPLVIRDQERTEYIEALEDADSGKLGDLVQIFSKRQKEAVLTALGLEQQVQQSRYPEEIISSAISLLKARMEGETTKLQQVYPLADHLHKIAADRFSKIAEILDNQLYPLIPSGSDPYKARAKSANNNSPDKHFFFSQIVEIAKKFNYFANVDKYRSWVRLSIHTEINFEFVVSLHGYGYGDSGIVVSSAFTFQRVPREESTGTDYVNTQPASLEIFQLNYADDLKNAEKRFQEWLEGAITIALAEWRRVIQG